MREPGLLPRRRLCYVLHSGPLVGLEIVVFCAVEEFSSVVSWCEEMIKTKFTRNGREVMIWGGALRTFDYGSEEAVQQSNKDGNGGGSEEVVQQSKKGGKGGDGSVSEPKRSAKKGGKRGASVSLSSPERSRKSKRRRGTQYGSPVSSPEKVTRCGTPYGGSTPSPRQSKKQKVTGGSTVSPPENSKKNQVDGDDREECLQRETNEMNPPSEEEEFGNIEDDCRRELEDSRLELENENESQAQFSQAQSSQAHSSQAQASRWEVPQSSQASQTGVWKRWFS
ncbi:hypothetical protein HID58_081282 [Brassica napus]|uniref:Uncharacterized protein n=1 Tax=Brassica napus TaxID=3708 RepID=A0ABQ7YA48_BRANA|nr:hypothetical protein HID58_081282 [Brassica napus]